MIDLPIVLTTGGIRPFISADHFVPGHPELIGAGIMPAYGSEGAAAMDFFAPVGFTLHNTGNSVCVDTGVRMAIPFGYGLLLMPRSGLGCKGVKLMNTVGLIDSDYRGTIRCELYLDKPNDNPMIHIDAGKAFVQGKLLPIEQARFILQTELPETERGEGGFGSTTKE